MGDMSRVMIVDTDTDDVHAAVKGAVDIESLSEEHWLRTSSPLHAPLPWLVHAHLPWLVHALDCGRGGWRGGDGGLSSDLHVYTRVCADVVSILKG